MATKNPSYGYTIADDVDKSLPDQSGDKFDVEKLMRGQAQLVESDKPDRKAMRYMEASYGQFPKPGAGRGKQGGPTAKELQKYEAKQNEGIFTEGKKVPQDIDGGSAPRKSAQERMQEYRAQKKGIPVDEMRKKAGAEYDKKMKAGEFYAKGGMTASKRADGIAQRGKTRGKMC